MAVTVDTGLSATDDPLAGDLRVSMDDRVANVDKNTSQFATMLMKLDVKTAKSFKEEFLSDQYLPKNTALAASGATADTVLTVTTNEGSYAKAGDIIKLVESGEAARIVTAGASAWTVVRAIGSVVAATAATGTTNGGIIIINGSNEQGAEMPTALVTEKTQDYNYMQIVRNAFRYTNTAQWVGWYSGNPMSYQRFKIATEHKRELEQGLFFGARSYTAGTNAPRGTFGGLDHFVTTNVTTNLGGTMDAGELSDFLLTGVEYGDPSRKVLFAAPKVAQTISELLQNSTWVTSQATGANVWGVKVDYVIEGALGAKIPIVVKMSWNRFGTGSGKQIGSRAYLVDMSEVELRKAPPVKAGPRYLSLYDNRQNPSADEMAEEYLSEVTFIVKSEKAHAILMGVTG